MELFNVRFQQIYSELHANVWPDEGKKGGGGDAWSDTAQPCRHIMITKVPISPVDFKNSPCRMSLRSPCHLSILRKAPVAVSILGVHTHSIYNQNTTRKMELFIDFRRNVRPVYP